MMLRTTFYLFLLLLTTLPAHAQSVNATLSGTVKDESGAFIADAAVTLTNAAIGIQRTTTSDQGGQFVIVQLPPGTYALAVERNGFAPTAINNIVLQTGERVALEVRLKIGNLGETVNITADAGQLGIKAESGERSEVITNQQIKDLALNGRNLLDLVKVIPGVTSTVNGQVSGQQGLNQFNVNGTRANQHEVQIDGSSNVDTGANASTQVTINPDAVAEVKVLTSNYQAEFGKAGGGTLLYVTKSGTKDFHATGRLFHRHEGLNANNFFRNAEGRNANGTEIQPRQLYRYNYFGYDLSGPVYLPKKFFGPLGGWNESKTRLLFFWNQEFYRQLVPNPTFNVQLPTLAERRGDFSQTVDGNGNRIFIRDPERTGACNATSQAACFPNNIIPANRFFAFGPEILNLYPQPNVAGRTQFNYTSAVSDNLPRREDVLRLDFNLTEATRLTARIIRNAERSITTYYRNQNLPLTPTQNEFPGTNASFTLIHTFSPTLTNEFIFGPSKSRRSFTPLVEKTALMPNIGSFPFLYPAGRAATFIPNFTYGGIANQTFPTSNLDEAGNYTSTVNFVDNLTKVWGAHTFKTGIFIQRSRKDQTGAVLFGSTTSFANDANHPLNTGHPYANALLGIYQSYQQGTNLVGTFLRYVNVEGYAQDTWRVNRRFTLDYGLRLAYYQPQYDKELQLNYFNPDLFERGKAVRLYEPVLVGTQQRAVDPANRPAVPALTNTLASAFVGLIVPNSGNPTNGIGQAAQGYPRAGFTSDPLVFAPRLGFALDLTGDGRTVVRGGIGIAYDRVGGNQSNNAITNPPNVAIPRLSFGRLQELNTVGSIALAPPNITGTPRVGQLPTIYSYSLGVQRNIGFDTVLDVAYVGTLMRHLGQQRDVNAIAYGATFLRENQDPTRFAGGVVPTVEPNLPAAYAQAGLSFSGANAKRIEFLRPFPGYGSIAYREYSGTGNYNGLQIALNRRFTRSLAFGVSYTFSKTFNTANLDTDTTHPFDVRRYDYRLASYDRTHVFVANYIYSLPKLSRWLGDGKLARLLLNDYQVSGISQFSTGTPLELALTIQGINTGQRITGSYTEAPRFFLNSNPARNQNGLVLDPAAFVIPAIGNIGPYPRAYLRNPGVHNHDLSLFKNVPLGNEGSRFLQLRVELFNAFNHTQFSGINTGTQLTTATGGIGANVFASYSNLAITNNLRPAGSTAPLGRFFGEYNSARDPRIVQLAVKLYF